MVLVAVVGVLLLHLPSLRSLTQSLSLRQIIVWIPLLLSTVLRCLEDDLRQLVRLDEMSVLERLIEQILALVDRILALLNQVVPYPLT